MSDPVNPDHYDSDKVWPLAEEAGFNRGNAIKYIVRAGVKDPTKYIEDLDKAIRYLEREKDHYLEQGRREERKKNIQRFINDLATDPVLNKPIGTARLYHRNRKGKER